MAAFSRENVADAGTGTVQKGNRKWEGGRLRFGPRIRIRVQLGLMENKLQFYNSHSRVQHLTIRDDLPNCPLVQCYTRLKACERQLSSPNLLQRINSLKIALTYRMCSLKFARVCVCVCVRPGVCVCERNIKGAPTLCYGLFASRETFSSQ